MSEKEIIDNIPQMIWKVEEENNIIYSNKNWKEYTNDAKIIFPNNLIHPEDIQLNWRQNSIKHRIKNTDGNYRWFLTRAIFKSGVWFGSCTDIEDMITISDEKNKIRIKLAGHAEILAKYALENEKDKIIAEKTRITLGEEVENQRNVAENTRLLLAGHAEVLANEKGVAENTRLLLVEEAKILADNVIKKELEKVIADKVRITLGKKVANEKVVAENTRLILVEQAKILANYATENEKERIKVADEKNIAETTRLLLAEEAKILANNVIKKEIEKNNLYEKNATEKDVAESTRLILVEKAKVLVIEKEEATNEKDIAENTRLLLAEKAKILANNVIKREEEKVLAEKTRIALIEHADKLSKEVVKKEEERILAEKIRIKLFEDAKILALDVLEKDNLAQHARIVLSKHAKVLAGEVLITNELLLQMQLDKIAAVETYALRDKANEEAMAEMTHEIRNPLNGVIGIIDLMSDIDLRPDLKEYVDNLKEVSITLSNVVNDVLDLFKMDANKLQIECISFKPNELLSELQMAYSAIIQSKGIELKIEKNDEDEYIYGDPHRIKQIMNNLISNSVKFTTNGTITIKINVKDDFVIYSVIDTGIGIDEKKLKELFQPFQQLDASTSRIYGGSGLGLSICKKLVKLMNGEMNAESVIGSGSTFWAKIPKP
jgi:signal transduction histidine kinase